MKNVILASASPRRKELFSIIENDFDIIPSKVEEIVPDGVSALEQAEYLATLKACDISKRYPNSLVIGADTCVVAEGKVLGKPKDKADADFMLRLLSGKIHRVVTGCAICYKEKTISFSNVTDVEFYPLTDSEIEEYTNTSEPYDKAGAYGIQGKAGLFVKGIKGDYFNVVGLPVSQLNKILNEFKKTEL